MPGGCQAVARRLPGGLSSILLVRHYIIRQQTFHNQLLAWSGTSPDLSFRIFRVCVVGDVIIYLSCPNEIHLLLFIVVHNRNT